MRSTRGVLRALAAASAFAAAAMPSGADAGLFDEIGKLFGGGVQSGPGRLRSEPLASGGEPLRFRVAPRHRRPAVKAASRRLRGAPAPSIRKLTLPINPQTDPLWHLHDPTLRLGDVVVLPGEVLVFQGGRLPYSREHFAPLGASRLSVADKQKLRAMTGVKEDRVVPAAKAQTVAAAPVAGEKGSHEVP